MTIDEGTKDYQPNSNDIEEFEKLSRKVARERLSKAIEESKKNNNNRNRNRNEDGDGGNGNGDAKQKQKEKHSLNAYKYSKNGKGRLFEAIILSGSPVFITYENGKIEPYRSIEEDVRTIEPPHIQSYPYNPYQFKNMNEILEYRDRALAENIDSLYQKAKQIAEDYNDQRKEKTNLLAIEIISSYFQDQFPTVHYTIVLGRRKW